MLACEQSRSIIWQQYQHVRKARTPNIIIINMSGQQKPHIAAVFTRKQKPKELCQHVRRAKTLFSSNISLVILYNLVILGNNKHRITLIFAFKDRKTSNSSIISMSGQQKHHIAVLLACEESKKHNVAVILVCRNSRKIIQQ